ncbi:sugar ABC transporter substrate-binding protein [Clavibacter michiganensis]|uniref:Multiple sugar-binding periplasmic receptor ChvE n=1 Tax=Clavibacter michiganensis TaxID=28447 RepID=A0A251XRR9_9MICO|nr:sugar-binding protein [Clavibacter michiganensis]OUE08170.1 Multiple sugar-binding periplasmic receptor ChvE precursor [Clavibacter michiganensis]PPF52635.1 sugar ABC transporter substrate-binding protein [Clavibacter michiganensis]PPF66430.1 sugar ABC transporter substrate-binding protein [Clavibacter michiganensis]
MKMKKVLVGIAATSIALSLAACSGGGGGRGGAAADGEVNPADTLVGVAMPTKTSERWVDDGNNVQKQLTDLGYQVDLQYANDKVQDQISQIETMLNKGAKALIVASIDGTALTQVLKTAADDGVKVIAYDRLINGTEDVDYYTTFDNQQVGVLQGNSLLQGMGLVDADGNSTGSTEKKTIEIFAGSPDDNNALFFYDGAMSVLKPFLDSGQVTIGSGQSEFSQVAIQQWKLEGAQARMENLLSGSYGGGQQLDGVLSPYDGLSRGVINALRSSGTADDAMPIITGQDGEKASDKLILDGVQYSTIFKDTRLLGAEAVTMVDDLLKGETPDAPDTYDNKVKDVPTKQFPPVTVTKDNLIEVIVDSGYYTQDEIDKGE